MSNAAISIQNLTKKYGSFKAVDNISFEIPEGDFVAFLGPNGAGKTTTIQSITGLSNFSEGQVKVFGHDVVRDYRLTRPLIGLCPQEVNLDPFLSIEGVLIYQAGYFGIPPKKAQARAKELLDYFHLYEKRSQDFRKLSGGMKRRLLLCRALVHDPKILILDEPTAGTDLELKYQIWDYLKRLNDEGRTIFLTTHYMEEAERLSKTVIILDRGRIVHSGKKEDLLKDHSLETRFLEIVKKAGADA